jgi:uncharacterized protein with PIN domain
MRRNKDAKSKSAKSKAQVQTVSDAAYAAVSRDEAAMVEVPKAMAAAANAEVSAPSSSLTAATLSSSLGPDAGTIARIVESVMADLRPKIVEEIVKKLAGK